MRKKITVSNLKKYLGMNQKAAVVVHGVIRLFRDGVPLEEIDIDEPEYELAYENMLKFKSARGIEESKAFLEFVNAIMAGDGVSSFGDPLHDSPIPKEYLIVVDFIGEDDKQTLIYDKKKNTYFINSPQELFEHEL